MKKIENPVRHPPSPMQDKIQYRVFSGTQKGSHAKIFGIARQNNPTEKRDTLAFINNFFFYTITFLKHKCPSCESFRYCETKEINKHVMQPPPPMCEKI